MADKNIRMRRKLADGTFDTYYPLTKAANVSMADGSSVETKVIAHLADYVRQPAYGPTTGSANTYLFASTPALPALVDGVSAYLDVNVANTGASTLNWDGKGAKAIVDGKGAALTAGKMPLNGIVGVRYNASTGNFQLVGEGGDIPVSGSQTYATPGTYTFTVPSGVTRVVAQLWGGGGGGAYSQSGAPGGSGGAYVMGLLNVTPNDTISVVVGVGGNGAQSTGAGSPGGTSLVTHESTTITANPGISASQGTNPVGGAATTGSNILYTVAGGNGASSTGYGGSAGGAGTTNNSGLLPGAGVIQTGGIGLPGGGIGTGYSDGIAPGGGGHAGYSSHLAGYNGAPGKVVFNW